MEHNEPIGSATEKSILRAFEAEGPGRDILSEGTRREKKEAKGKSTQIMLRHTGT